MTMARFSPWSLPLLVYLPSVLGKLTFPNQQCVDGCNNAFGSITFDGMSDGEDDFYKSQCNLDVIVKSYFFCATIYCPPAEITTGLPLLNDSCLSSGYSLPSYVSVMGALIVDPKTLDGVRRVSQDDITEETYDEPVVPDAEFFQNSYGTASASDNNFLWSWMYGYACIGYFALILLVGMANRALMVIKRATTDRNHARDVVSRPLCLPRAISTRLRQSLILPATFGGRALESFGDWGTIPPRLETLLLILFFVMNFVFYFPGYYIFAGNIRSPDIRVQLSQYIADRTGIISFAKFPLIWLFAMRNDPFLWLTGWSFAAYNRFHRWVARLATFEAIVHSVAYSLFGWYEGNFAESWQEEYWYMGGVATITMSLLMGASAYWLRKYHYELFRSLHIILALATLVGMWYHIKIFTGEYDGWFWPCVAMWCLDWLIRIGRITSISIIPRLTRNTKATATYNANTNMIRINVTNYLRTQRSRPGHYYFVSQINSIRCLESHPMTLCTWTQADALSPSSSEPPSGASVSGKETEPTYRPLRTNQETSDQLTHSFLIRPYGGWTSRFQKQLIQQSTNGTSEITVLLEGPYGEEFHLTHFTDVLIVAGGSGITAAIASSCTLLHTRGCKTEIHIVWAVRELPLVEDVLQHELSSAAGDPRVKIDIYYTPDENAKYDKSRQSEFYTVHMGRPDVDAIIGSDRQHCSGSLAFVCCGPTPMADACRQAVVRQLGEPGPSIEFFNDSMIW